MGASAFEPGSSIVDMLRSDHRAIDRLLADPELLAASTEGLAAREQLVMELVRHFVAEEQYLFPALREHLPDGRAIAEGEFRRDRACEHRLRALEDPDIDAPRLAATVEDVRTAVAQHVADQDVVFTALQAACSAAVLAELGDGVLGAELLAPTRPRPVAPPSAAVNKVTSFVEGFLDHVRDYYARRGVDSDDRER